ncbi:MAG: 50S ribosomal protein L10 [bacterium]|nr:50S ribosomal protein L10 [bacterium]
MAITKAKKKEVYAEIEKIADASKSIVFVNFHGLKVADATSFRRNLTKNGVGFYIAKKTIAKKALETKKITGEIPELEGEIGFAYGTDLMAPAREVFEFSKLKKDSVAIIGGVFDGKFMSKDEMLSIATIPPLKTLHGMFVNIINSPIQGFVVALDAISKKKIA